MFSVSLPLVATKFSPPAADRRQVPRQALCSDIVATPARLVLVRAPAGFGKTTIMAQTRQRLAHDGIATSWLTLDSADNDPARFLTYLRHALEELLPSHPPALPGSGELALGEVALATMEAFAAIPFPYVLFLDEVEAVQSPGVVALLAQLIHCLPAGAKLVMSSRNIPDLRLARLRASGQLFEVDARLLRLSLEETRRFFGGLGAGGLDDDEIAALHRKTEGWVAALWLAWLALERHERPREFIASFSGREQSVAEYLAEEVLSQQPADVRRLLLASSILREVSEPLCDVLLPGMQTGRLMRQLAEANVFLAPVEGRPGHWRYHSLFASFLRAQLQREMPGEQRRLHLAAARWFLSQARPVPAVDHFIEAGEYAEAIDVLRREAMPLLMHGRLRLLTRWFDALPAPALAAEPLLQVAHLWSLCFTCGPQAAIALLGTSDIERSSDPEIKVHVAALRASMLALLDEWEEAHAVGSRSLHLLPSPSAFANASLVNVTASAGTVLGLFPQARQLLQRARQSQGQGASAFHRMYSETIEGMIDLIEGRLNEPRARFRLAVQTTQDSTLDAAQGNAWAGLLYAGAIYESGDLRQARRLLQVYLPLARDAWLSDHVIVGYRMLSRIAFAEGEVDHAFQDLSELEYIGYERRLPRLAAAARVERARMLLLQGHADAANEELRGAGTPEMWRQIGARRHLGHDWEDQEIGLVRWQLLAGDPRKAAVALEAMLAQAMRTGRLRRALKLRLLHAMALLQASCDDEAQAAALPVLQTGCAEDLVRLVVDEGPVAGRLVARVWARMDPQQTGPIFADYLQRVLVVFGPLTVDEPVSATPPPLMEALTPKEIRLLQLLAEGYSNRALTEKLFVSDSTVRTHLRNINGKLGANNRTQAVAMARRLGLIR
ncbi:MAG: LuxR C-terminal-related transcriptional regulator [Rubrivivax sp.]